MLNRVLLVAAFIALSACAPAKPRPVVKMTLPFSEAEHSSYLAKNVQTVRGQAFLKQRGGGTVTCAGNAAFMFPDTPYYNEAIRIIFSGGEPDAGDNKTTAAYSHIRKRSTCDAQGNFEFDAVAPGKWVVLAGVNWDVGGSRQGGPLLQRIEVKDGGTNRFLMTDADLVKR